jgi:hypothetical protein
MPSPWSQHISNASLPGYQVTQGCGDRLLSHLAQTGLSDSLRECGSLALALSNGQCVCRQRSKHMQGLLLLQHSKDMVMGRSVLVWVDTVWRMLLAATAVMAAIAIHEQGIFHCFIHD